MKVLITGSNGFIGKNLKLFLKERTDIEIISFNKEHDASSLTSILKNVDFIFHLAGVNRTGNKEEFTKGNEKLTQELCEAIKKTNRKIPVIFSSSIQSKLDNPYGISKNNTENILLNFSEDFKIPIHIFRLPNVFGKWSKPNYNSVVSTFCYNIVRDIPVNINNSKTILNLVHIDDVIKEFINIMDNLEKRIETKKFKSITPLYQITVGDLAKQLYAFKEMRNSNILERVGKGLVRALYSTYVSYFPEQQFSHPIKTYNDSRGIFMEMLKTPDCGQFSCFTVLPNITRGNHYHHSKTEKFLVIKGNACFKFLQLDTSKIYELNVNSDKPEIVESIPGWAHSITNIGKEEMTVMLWSNEIFDHSNPDTFASKI